MKDYLSSLITEQLNMNTKAIDECDTDKILEIINTEDCKVAYAVKKELAQITKAVNIIYDCLCKGGRLLYFGAGTSGRLGVLDASEIPPTYGTDPSLVQAYIAGGDCALRTAVEGSEDSEEDGMNQVISCNVTKADVVVGISASGNAAYVLGVLRKANELGTTTIGLVNNKGTKLESLCNVCIAPIVGAEVISGSTRMKAGTAQKMVLNLLTTATMIKLGKVYGNMMVDLKASNLKLNNRAVRIITTITGVSDETARQYLAKANGKTKIAIMMLLSGCSREESDKLLVANQGYLKKALSHVNVTKNHE